MPKLRIRQPATATLAACIVLGLGGMTSARAAILTNSPSLPLLDVPYNSSVDAGCFATMCVSAGSLTLTSASSTFDITGQNIVANATYSAMLTDLFGAPIGTVNLTGTLQEEVVDRVTDTDTGLWATDITAFSLSGTALSQTVTMAQDPDNASTGATSVTSNGDGTYLVTSFFDMFVDLSLSSDPVQTADTGPIYFDVSVPEPSTLALLAVPVFALAVLRRRPKA
jgi:hypothetical protein